MPEALDDDEIQEIIDTYKDIGNMAEVADELGRSTSTVRKYVNEWQESKEETEEYEVEEDDEAEIDFSHMFANESEVERGVDFSGMSPGDFVSWYFEEDLDIVNVKSVDFLSRRCDSKEAIPTEKKITNILRDLPSDLGNDTQIQWIAEDYWSRARDYAAAKLGISAGDVRQRVIQKDADWVKVSGGPNRQSQVETETESSTVDFSQGQQGGSQDAQESYANPAGNPAQNQNGYQQPNQPQMGQQNQQGGQQMMMFQQMMEEFQQQQQQMMQMMMEQNQSSNQDQDSSLTNQVKEIAEVQQMLESIGGDDGDQEQMVNALSQELSKIQHQIQQGDANPVQNEDPLAGAFINLAERDDVDPEMLTAVATNFGVDSDPEVKKKELDKEIEMMKMQQRQELANDMIDGLGEIVENASSIGSLLAQGGQQGGQMGQQQAEPAQGGQGEVYEEEPQEPVEEEEDGFDLADYASEQEEEKTPEEEEIKSIDDESDEVEEEDEDDVEEEEVDEEPAEEPETEEDAEVEVDDEDVQEEAEVA